MIGTFNFRNTVVRVLGIVFDLLYFEAHEAPKDIPGTWYGLDLRNNSIVVLYYCIYSGARTERDSETHAGRVCAERERGVSGNFLGQLQRPIKHDRRQALRPIWAADTKPRVYSAKKHGGDGVLQTTVLAININSIT